MATQAAQQNANKIYGIEGSKNPVEKNRHRSSSSLAGCSNDSNEEHSPTRGPFRRSSSLSFSAEFAQDAALEATPNESLKLLPSQKDIKYPIEDEKSLATLKTQRNGRGVPWQWWRIRKGIRTSKMIRRSTYNQRAASKGKHLQEQVLLPRDSINSIHQDAVTDFSFNSACSRDKISHGKVQFHSSLSQKYQPKLFQDITGHEIIVKALYNAVQKGKVAPLYLFHGPSGTGKTSTARIFAMALNCESTSHTKPCWSCKGCSRSLYIMELCTGSRISGFERIKTLLQSTKFTQTLSGFKVFIIEECHSLTAEAWEEILGIVEGGNDSTKVFVMITEDANMVPRAISSRCQKFCFPKLKDMDIILKLARIVAQEDIEIDRDALKLIISKAEGSLREAENILDQLALLGSRITSSIVQQIVGLVPHDKLLDLITTAISADTIKTVRSSRELIASGVHPQSLVSQLASLITDILSGAAAMSSSAGSSKDKRLLRSGSQLTNNQSEKLSHALKILVETEKQLSSSSDHTTWVVAALLQIASEQISNRISTGIVLPTDIVIPSDEKFEVERRNSIYIQKDRLSDLVHHSKSRTYHHSINSISEQPDINTNDPSTTIRSVYKTKRCTSKTVERESNLAQLSDIEEVWQSMLGRIQSGYVKEFLCQQVKLASLTISSANAIVHLMFKRPEDKLAAQMSEETISEALKNAFGYPVTVNMSLEPMPLEIIERTCVSTTKSQVTNSGYSRQQQGTPIIPASESQYNPNTGKVEMHRSKSQNSSSVSENNLRPTRLQEFIQNSQAQEKCPSGVREASTARPQQIQPFSGLLVQGNTGDASADPEIDPSTRDRSPWDMTQITRATKPKQRWLSLSSIQQGDASVEPYSQDLLFDNANTDREKGERRNSKLHKGSSKAHEDQNYQHSATRIILSRSWSCSDIFCRGETKIKKRTA